MQSNETWSSQHLQEELFTGVLCREVEFEQGEGKWLWAFFNLTFKVNQDTKEKVAAQQHCTVTEFSWL